MKVGDLGDVREYDVTVSLDGLRKRLFRGGHVTANGVHQCFQFVDVFLLCLRQLLEDIPCGRRQETGKVNWAQVWSVIDIIVGE